MVGASARAARARHGRCAEAAEGKARVFEEAYKSSRGLFVQRARVPSSMHLHLPVVTLSTGSPNWRFSRDTCVRLIINAVVKCITAAIA